MTVNGRKIELTVVDDQSGNPTSALDLADGIGRAHERHLAEVALVEVGRLVEEHHLHAGGPARNCHAPW